MLEPLDHVVGIGAELALGGVERLAALAHPVVERGLVGRAVGHELHAAVALGEERLGHRGHVVVAPAELRAARRRRLEGGLVVERGHRVGAEADAVELAVDLAAVDLVGVEVVEVEDAAVDELVERLRWRRGSRIRR